MKLPRYIQVSNPFFKDGETKVSISVKKWGWPILLFKRICKIKAKWYAWPLIWAWKYPKLCIKAIRGG
jgi:hypothetical protein